MIRRALALNCNAAVNEKEGAEAKDWKAGKPVRVVRSSKGRKHSKYCPEDGNRYDGIYKVSNSPVCFELDGPVCTVFVILFILHVYFIFIHQGPSHAFIQKCIRTYLIILLTCIYFHYLRFYMHLF